MTTHTVRLAVLCICFTVSGRIIVRSAHVEATMATHLHRIGQATYAQERRLNTTHHGRSQETWNHSIMYCSEETATLLSAAMAATSLATRLPSKSASNGPKRSASGCGNSGSGGGGARVLFQRACSETASAGGSRLW